MRLASTWSGLQVLQPSACLPTEALAFELTTKSGAKYATVGTGTCGGGTMQKAEEEAGVGVFAATLGLIQRAFFMDATDTLNLVILLTDVHVNDPHVVSLLEALLLHHRLPIPDNVALDMGAGPPTTATTDGGVGSRGEVAPLLSQPVEASVEALLMPDISQLVADVDAVTRAVHVSEAAPRRPVPTSVPPSVKTPAAKLSRLHAPSSPVPPKPSL